MDHLGVAILFTTLEVKFLLDEALASDEFPTCICALKSRLQRETQDARETNHIWTINMNWLIYIVFFWEFWQLSLKHEKRQYFSKETKVCSLILQH